MVQLTVVNLSNFSCAHATFAAHDEKRKNHNISVGNTEFHTHPGFHDHDAAWKLPDAFF